MALQTVNLINMEPVATPRCYRLQFFHKRLLTFIPKSRRIICPRINALLPIRRVGSHHLKQDVSRSVPGGGAVFEYVITVGLIAYALGGVGEHAFQAGL